MFRVSSTSSRCALGVAVALCFMPMTATFAAGKFKVVYAFSGGSDGGHSYNGLVRDKAGNLYGTAQVGGGAGCGGHGCGTVFAIAPNGVETTLHSFAGGIADGSLPYSGLTADRSGNLFGTTQTGGGTSCDGNGCGTIYTIATGGEETVLHSFTGKSDGSFPSGGVLLDSKGNLYGTTFSGGGKAKFGTIYEVASNGSFTVLHAFAGGTDGGRPLGNLIADKAGNLYGVTRGGEGFGDFGTVYKVTPEGTKTILYAFQGGSDGVYPEAGLIMDGAGDLYGTTSGGGRGPDAGVLFKVFSTGGEIVMHPFQGGADGSTPYGSLVMDSSGNLYGTTVLGGSGNRGTVFEIQPDATETILYSFTGENDGGYPYSELFLKKNTLYGTTYIGGAGYGDVFQLKK